MLQNLVENALTHHSDDPPVVRFTGEERDDGSVHVVGTDRGPGIPKEFHDRVFQIFHQLDPHGEGRERDRAGPVSDDRGATRRPDLDRVRARRGFGLPLHAGPEPRGGLT